MPETIQEKKKGRYRSRPGASRAMPETIQKGKKKGGYKGRPGARGGMRMTGQKGRRKGGYTLTPISGLIFRDILDL